MSFDSRIGVVLTLGLAWVLAMSGQVNAQDISIDLGDGAALSSRVVQMIVLVTVLSLAPGLAIMVTAFPFIVTVLAILRHAIGLQQSPPNMLIVSLALFLTWFVMDPVFSAAWTDGVQPLIDGSLDTGEAAARIFAPFRTFMSSRVDPDTLAALSDLRGPAGPSDPINAPGLPVLIPAFLLGEIQRAFEIGFLIYLPFLVIDLVVAAVLMSMGMMMVPPAIVSLPFKLAFFVVADGWNLIAGALVRSYS